MQQKPLEWEYNKARHRESNVESARSRRLDDIHIRINQGPGASLLLFSEKKLLLMRHKYEARLFKDKRTATRTTFLSVATKIRFRLAFRCTPRMLLPPPPLDGLLTDSTNYGCKWRPPTFVEVSAKCFVSNFELAVWISNKDKNQGLRMVAIVNTSNVEQTWRDALSDCKGSQRRRRRGGGGKLSNWRRHWPS